MIDTSKTIGELIREGVAIAILRPVTLLTDDVSPLHIGALDVHVLCKNLHKSCHDTKPWKMAVGTDNISQAQIVSEQMLAAAAADNCLKAIMAEHTII